MSRFESMLLYVLVGLTITFILMHTFITHLLMPMEQKGDEMSISKYDDAMVNYSVKNHEIVSTTPPGLKAVLETMKVDEDEYLMGDRIVNFVTGRMHMVLHSHAADPPEKAAPLTKKKVAKKP